MKDKKNYNLNKKNQIHLNRSNSNNIQEEGYSFSSK